MQTKAAFLMGLWPAAALAALTTSITLHIPASHQLPDPWRLPPSTHATLTSLRVAASAPLTTGNTLVFRNVSAGSYLVDVHAATHAFMPVRLDVAPDAAAEDGQALRVEAWETYRGNDWANKGEAIPLSADGRLEMRALGPKGYFSERSSFSVLTILKNPMILLGLVSMAIFIGMPKLVENSKCSSAWEIRSCDLARWLISVFCSGPRDARGVGEEPEEQPDEQPPERRGPTAGEPDG